MFKPDYQIDISWLYKLSYKLEGFSKSNASGSIFASRCIICGDSAKTKKKRRLIFYTKKGSLNYDCKNCGAHGSFYTFVREVFPQDFDEYKKEQLLDRFKGSPSNKKTKRVSNILPKEESVATTPLDTSIVGCIPLDEMDAQHPAVLYANKRCLPLDRLYYTDNFKAAAQSISPDELSSKFPNESRIVIPFYTKDGLVEMIQGRSLDPNSKMRYITIKSSEEVDKIYGKERIDLTQTTYCVEGPFDSMFIENCVATCDSALQKSSADVLIFDNEPMNKDICNIMRKAIDNGRSVVVWPTRPFGKIDINDMMIKGISRVLLMEVIRKRTYTGIMALHKYNQWKRV